MCLTKFILEQQHSESRNTNNHTKKTHFDKTNKRTAKHNSLSVYYIMFTALKTHLTNLLGQSDDFWHEIHFQAENVPFARLS